MRLFTAIELPKELAKEIHRDFSFISSRARLVPPQNLHITIDFIGEADEGEMKEIKERLVEWDKPEPFTIRLANPDAFPSKDFIRVLVLRAFVDESVEEKLKEICEGSCFSSLHLTVARVKRRINAEDFFSFSKAYAFEAHHITLFESFLSKPYPIYKPLLRL